MPRRSPTRLNRFRTSQDPDPGKKRPFVISRESSRVPDSWQREVQNATAGRPGPAASKRSSSIGLLRQSLADAIREHHTGFGGPLLERYKEWFPRWGRFHRNRKKEGVKAPSVMHGET